ncbi:MAG: N-acetyltransferase, partial [Flavobacteriaceae bacterium]|nr:N-acetyltransferase [Flavobacteriaceae bacterium]
MKIRPINPKDWQEIARIYKQGIDTGIATFETEVPSWEDWDASHITSCRLAAWIANRFVGWATLSAVSGRCVYGGVGEVSVYVDKDHYGKGVGYQLLKKLINESEKEGYWTLQSGIFLQNIASIKLHEKLGFRKIGYREKIGKLHG